MKQFWHQIVRSPSKLFAAGMICFVFGVAIYDIWYHNQFPLPTIDEALSPSDGNSVRIEGVVVAEVQNTSYGQRILVDDLFITDGMMDGKLLLYADAYPVVSYGDTIVFNCEPQLPEPIETFRYDLYLRSQGVMAICFRPRYVDITSSDTTFIGSLLAIKRVITDRLAMIIPEPHASFLSGLLFGGSSALSTDLKDDFAATGTSHILAASGFNVSLFSMTFLYWITHTFLGRRRGTYLTAGLLFVYVLIAGASPAIVRAGIMGSLTLVGFLIQRKPYMVNVLLLALSIMLLQNPLLLLDDVGFQLSFMATAAMVLYATRVEKYCTYIPEIFALRKSFSASMCAIVATLPIMLWHFGTASITAPIVNLLVLPLVPMLMSVTGIAIVTGFIFPPLGMIVVTPAFAFSSVILHLITWFGSI